MLPLSPSKSHATAADNAACRRILREGSISFNTASRFLPLRLRGSISSFYAFCRIADDAVDHSLDKRASLERLKIRLDAVYKSQPAEHAVDRAFADAVARYQLPRYALDLLLEGFEWDCAERQYHSLSDVVAYSVRVAGTVGVIMAHFMGVRDRHAMARAIDLGIAMQLTNIARDVGEDAYAGRLYLPRDWLRAEGVDVDAFLRSPQHSPQLTQVVKRLLAEADRLYKRADSGIAALGGGVRPAIFAARSIYHAIGSKVARSGYDSISRRAVVGRGRKAQLMLASYMRALKGGVASQEPVLPEAAELFAHIMQAQETLLPPPTRTDRMIWALGLLAREDVTDG